VAIVVAWPPPAGGVPPTAGKAFNDMYTVYIIKSSKNDHYYVGFTSDIAKRIFYHNSGKNRSTKNKGPWELIYAENFDDKKVAWLREKQIKSYKGGEAFRKLLNSNYKL